MRITKFRLIYVIWMALLALICLLSLPYLFHILGILFFPKSVNILSQLQMYQWAAVGVALFYIVKHFQYKNLEWAAVFSHELIHAFITLIINGRVHSFQAGERGGVVTVSGFNKITNIIIDLGPYTLPIFTYLLLSIRWLMNFRGIWIYDMLIGITIGFHIYCFKTQTRSNQPDINKHPLVFSYFYIITGWLINLCILLPAFFPNMNGQGHQNPMYHYGMWSCIWRWLTAMWDSILGLLGIG